MELSLFYQSIYGVLFKHSSFKYRNFHIKTTKQLAGTKAEQRKINSLFETFSVRVHCRMYFH